MLPPDAPIADPRPRRADGGAERGVGEGEAWFRGVRARRPVECVDVGRDPEALARGGFWAVVGDFEGPVRAWRFDDVQRGAGVDRHTATNTDSTTDSTTDTGTGTDTGIDSGSDDGRDAPPWRGPGAGSWTSSLDREAYTARVERVREAVRAGDVYQANLCRVLRAALPAEEGREPSARALAARLARGNPAPFAGGVHVPAGGALPPAWVVTASPELYLRLADGVLTSAPIKGTAASADGLTAKDRAENVMITDLVRNDLQRVCAPGTVEVTSLLRVEEHPGLAHLVSTVQGTLAVPESAGADLWARLLGATFPPGSVSGAPKSSALRLIAELEPVPRGPYCGVVGWIDSDAGRAELAVGIRTFWWTAGTLRFGTGAGITWGSDPDAEWAETELKARRLVALASAAGGPAGPH